MLIFHKTAAHPFLPSRHDDTAPEGPGCFSLHFPYQLHLLPGNRTVVDFLLTVSLPPRHRAVLRLKDSPRDALRLHAPPLSESSVSAEKNRRIHAPSTRYSLVRAPAKSGRHLGERQPCGTRRPALGRVQSGTARLRPLEWTRPRRLWAIPRTTALSRPPAAAAAPRSRLQTRLPASAPVFYSYDNNGG